MKAILKIIFTFIISLSAVTLTAQSILVVDNTSGAPDGSHVYDNIQDAILNAISGDIIHIRPSSESYGDFEVDKELKIYGIGYNPDKQAPIRSQVGNITIHSEGSGSVISGLQINQLRLDDNGSTDPVENIRIEKNYLTRLLTVTSSVSINQLLIQRNIIHSLSGTSTTVDLPIGSHVSNILISNNIFSGGSASRISAGNQTVISQNLILGSGSNTNAFGTLENSLVQNNIFLGVPPTSGTASNTSYNTFQNNLLFGASGADFPIGQHNNTGSDNLVDVDPMFENLETSSSQWDFGNWDATLQSGSPAIGAGNNGSDLGIFGGPAPFDMTMVPLPIIQAFNVPGFIGTDDELNVTIRARSNEN